MKVLWFSNNPANGVIGSIKGTGSWLAPLDLDLQQNVELSVAFHFPYKKESYKVGKTIYFPIYTGNIVINKLKEKFLHKAYDDEYLNQYLNIIRIVKPDIIHIHGTELPYAAIIGKVNIPIVISIQGNINVIFIKFKCGLGDKYINESHFSLSPTNILFNTNFYSNYLIRKNKSRIELKQLKNAEYIIGRTDWDRRISSVMAPQSKYFIGQEMMRKSFLEKKWQIKNNRQKITLFTTNGDSYFKGFETICHTLTILLRYGLNVEWQVAGISENSLIVKIVKKYLKNDYPEKGLFLLGSLNEVELSNYLLCADLYLMTSHIENSPNNLCEAMCLGMPCIATFAGGASSLLKDKEEGLLIQDGDPWVMAGAILEMINNPEKAVCYGENARIRALKRHNPENIVSDLIDTYHKIIADYKKK